MPIYDIEIRDGRKHIGYKYVRASSPSFIRSHKSRYLGPGRKIGKIVQTRIKNSSGARKAVRNERRKLVFW